MLSIAAPSNVQHIDWINLFDAKMFKTNIEQKLYEQTFKTFRKPVYNIFKTELRMLDLSRNFQEWI